MFVPQRSSVLQHVFLTALGVAVAWLCFASSAWAQQQVGTITQLSGTAQVQRAGATIGATLTMAVQLHDQLSTAADSSLTVTLVDNSTVSLYPSSTLVLDENVVAGGIRQRTLVRLLAGSMRAVVRIGRLIAPNNFDIQTPNALLGVRGTDFDTAYTEGIVRPGYEGCERYTDVRVREGVVAISNPATPAVVVEVSAGYETTVPCLLPPLTGGPIGITGAPAPGTATGGRTSAAAAVSGFSAPPPGVGSSPPPAPPIVKVVP